MRGPPLLPGLMGVEVRMHHRPLASSNPSLTVLCGLKTALGLHLGRIAGGDAVIFCRGCSGVCQTAREAFFFNTPECEGGLEKGAGAKFYTSSVAIRNRVSPSGDCLFVRPCTGLYFVMIWPVAKL